MTGLKKSDLLSRVFLGFAIFLILSIAAIFVLQAIDNAYHKNFWDDETYGLSVAKARSYTQHLLRGTQGQGSPAPLDYIFLKFLDAHYTPPLSNIPFNIYYRFNSICWTFLAGLMAASMAMIYFYRRRENRGILFFQIILIGIALMFFYFDRDFLHFAIETRPYALWNSLWYVMLLMMMFRGLTWWLLIPGILMAMTSLGAVIQIPVLALCQLIYRVIDGEKFWKSVGLTLGIFLPPILVAMYYAAHNETWSGIRNMQDFEINTVEFLVFWVNKWVPAALALAGVFLTGWNRQWRGATVALLTLLVLFCISPGINYHILSSHFFFVPRQYLYYDLSYPLFILTLALVLPGYCKLIFKKKL